MAQKFLVESGTLRMVVRADDARKAALWAVHRAMQQVLPMYDDESLSPEEKQACALRRGCMVMSEVIRLHEVQEGVGTRWHRFATFDIVTEWNKLMVALARLEQQMATAV